jgi:ubiquinone/menaquinone biosynthesis C-methylase UbiE
MDKDYELKHHKLEEDNWWFKTRREITLDLIQKNKGNKSSKILDIGCAGGHLLNFLKKRGFKNLYGVDISETAIKETKSKGIQNATVQDSINTNFKENTFDFIIASDILEHIKEDSKAIEEYQRILKKGGKLIVFVPAFRFLWSEHDEICHHFRRYKKQELKELISNKLQIKRISFWNFTLFPIISIVKIIYSIINKKSDQLYKTNPISNKILYYLLKTENQILKKINFPFGISLFCLSEKTQ